MMTTSPNSSPSRPHDNDAANEHLQKPSKQKGKGRASPQLPTEWVPSAPTHPTPAPKNTTHNDTHKAKPKDEDPDTLRVQNSQRPQFYDHSDFPVPPEWESSFAARPQTFLQKEWEGGALPDVPEVTTVADKDEQGQAPPSVPGSQTSAALEHAGRVPTLPLGSPAIPPERPPLPPRPPADQVQELRRHNIQDAKVKELQSMFPAFDLVIVEGVLSSCRGNMDGAVNKLLEISETGDGGKGGGGNEGDGGRRGENVPPQGNPFVTSRLGENEATLAAVGAVKTQDVMVNSPMSTESRIPSKDEVTQPDHPTIPPRTPHNTLPAANSLPTSPNHICRTQTPEGYDREQQERDDLEMARRLAQMEMDEQMARDMMRKEEERAHREAQQQQHQRRPGRPAPSRPQGQGQGQHQPPPPTTPYPGNGPTTSEQRPSGFAQQGAAGINKARKRIGGFIKGFMGRSATPNSQRPVRARSAYGYDEVHAEQVTLSRSNTEGPRRRASVNGSLARSPT